MIWVSVTSPTGIEIKEYMIKTLILHDYTLFFLPFPSKALIYVCSNALFCKETRKIGSLRYLKDNADMRWDPCRTKDYKIQKNKVRQMFMDYSTTGPPIFLGPRNRWCLTIPLRGIDISLLQHHDNALYIRSYALIL